MFGKSVKNGATNNSPRNIKSPRKTRARTQSETLGGTKSNQTVTISICDVCKTDNEVKDLLSKYNADNIINNVVCLEKVTSDINAKINDLNELNITLDKKISQVSLLDSKLTHFLMDKNNNSYCSNETFTSIEQSIIVLNNKIDALSDLAQTNVTNVQLANDTLNGIMVNCASDKDKSDDTVSDKVKSDDTVLNKISSKIEELSAKFDALQLEIQDNDRPKSTDGNSNPISSARLNANDDISYISPPTPRHSSDHRVGSTVIIGDSNLSRLNFGDDPASSFGKHMPGAYVKASHVSDLPNPASVLKHANIVIHTGINSIRGRNVPSIRFLVDKIISFCSSVHRMAPNIKIYVSALLPTKSPRLNKLVDFFNNSLFNDIMNIHKRYQCPLYYISHDNMRDSLTGQLNRSFGTAKAYDMVHLSDAGVRRFALNIKHCVLPRNFYDQSNRSTKFVNHRRSHSSKPVTLPSTHIPNDELDDEDLRICARDRAATDAIRQNGHSSESSFAEKLDLVNNVVQRENVCDS